MARILITGASGFVGRNLARYFASRASVVAASHAASLPADLSMPRVPLDITDENSVAAALDTARPDVVVHAAGNKNVRFCEDHPDEAHAINALGTGNMARACAAGGARLVYVSTDLVFEGSKGGYREHDHPSPTTAYGRTKFEGEQLAAQHLSDAIICRSAGIYGLESPLLGWLAGELGQGRNVECFTDVINTPTYVENLAEMIEAALERDLAGTFHMVGGESVSRYQLFRAFADAFDLDGSQLRPVEAGDRRIKMGLQPDASLSTERTRARLVGVPFNSVAEGFARLREVTRSV